MHRAIFLFGISIFSISIHSYGQVVYTDIIPDDTLFCAGCPSYPCGVVCDPPLYIDINNDGNNDFVVQINANWGSASCMGFPSVDWGHYLYSNPEDINAIGSQGGYFTRQFNLSDTIDSQVSWIDLNNLVIQSYVHSGCTNFSAGSWTGTGFIGLKLKFGSDEYYGWAKAYASAGISFFNPSLFILYEFAYNSIPNQFILAGDTGSGPTGIIHENIPLEQFIVYPNPATNSVTIEYPSREVAEITIVNLFGHIVFSDKVNAGQTPIDVSRFPSGIYLVRLKNEVINESKTFSIIK